MIEGDILTILEADTTLDTLLSAVSGDSKIYPVRIMQVGEGETLCQPPYILYQNAIGMEDEILDEDRIQFTIVAVTMLEVRNIRNRIKVLLDKQDEIQPVTSSTYWIYYSKLVDGGDGVEADLGYFTTTMTFVIKYKTK